MNGPDNLIVVIEDDADIREMIEFNLQREGFKTSSAETGLEGLRKAANDPPGLILLDLMLPDLSGLEVCRRLRSHRLTRDIPIIILTAKGEESDVIMGLELGADDYVRKPFSVRELVARVRAVLRRCLRPATESGSIRLGSLEIDVDRHEVRLEGQSLHLTLAEFRLLKALASHHGHVLTRDQLLDHITDGLSVIIDRNVDVHIRSIRKKLGSRSGLIQTVRGVGYKCREGE